jgi:hypothetical protein
MSRRSLQRRKILGLKAADGHFGAKHDTHPSQCGGDKAKFASTRPNTVVRGTGRWLGKGAGIGAIVTQPER